ncbi:50S ribosomal protein L15 [Candidatus Roizmanbacteria bacterium RIFCSPLOWO2_01_FULL_37_12]|uniref:Large ribosomal subunit protein uL15 n=1 Tax=Candidatus Roizmanbacteria bacterium RIFCSPLOWO2_01_FULL_37_12 TaxID=1802056 RepID=A0A1F7IBW6_9BACT|nr:MAG: 50S ribosomal protein L15 [Candidatus Roizmanbacteria bacterium RIFCSPHIGHO2_01_FULL_37_16]OGK26010.1 MAG: 50S ribosomal protein L15 [Candidatus Roizmanbacteria bacterium RIFCSPHIGHO2_02_FULL_37_9b]OGK40847.1 MAG: 50S ribosomal protein L15 [Candidatus Roizmanbacteria bacterium RIFCSPLOWO2_01_FULL_37_12]
MKNFLSNLPKIIMKKKKRLGRGLGSGRGAKSGRGTTRHQKGRESIPLHFEGGQARMVKRFPLLRGKGRNKPLKEKPFILNLGKLNVFKDNEVVDLNSLVKKGLIKTPANRMRVKILAGGKLERKLRVKVMLSKGAKTTIEKLGGKIEL